MTIAVPNRPEIAPETAMGKRVLVFSSIGHALMHMMTAFYAVIVLTLAIVWNRPPESLLELYAPSAVLLGIMSLPAGWLADRFGAPLMMVVMFVGLGLSSIACGLVAEGDTFALALALCGLGVFGAIYHSAGIGWIIRTAREQGHAMGVNGLWGSAGLALYGIVPGVLISSASWRAAFIVPGIVCLVVGAVLAWQIGQGKVGDRPMPATPGVQPGRREFWRVFSVLSVTMALEGVIWSAVMFGAALVFETQAGRRHRAPARRTRLVGRRHPGRAVGRTRDLDDLCRLGHRPVRHGPAHHRSLSAEVDLCHGLGAAGLRHAGAGHGQRLRALAGAIVSAVLSSAAGPVENILIARYTPSRYHGLGFGAKFVVALGASPIAIVLIAWVRKTTGSLDCCSSAWRPSPS